MNPEIKYQSLDARMGPWVRSNRVTHGVDIPQVGGGGVNCKTLPSWEADAQRQLGLARETLDDDLNTFLFLNGTDTNEARRHLERAAQHLNGQGDFRERIEGIRDSLPESDNLLVHGGETVDSETFEVQELQIEALQAELKGKLMECVAGVPLEQRVDQYATVERLEGFASTICLGAIAVYTVGLPVLRGLFYSGTNSKPRTK